jgi:predicted Zn-dependent protease
MTRPQHRSRKGHQRTPSEKKRFRALEPQASSSQEKHSGSGNPLAVLLAGAPKIAHLVGISKSTLSEWAERAHLFLRQGKWRRAESAFTMLHQMAPEDGYFLAALGAIAEQRKAYADAEAFYTRSIEKDPSAAFVFVHRAGVSLAVGRKQKAMDDLNEAIRLDPQSMMPATRRAQAMKHALASQNVLDGEDGYDVAPRSPKVSNPTNRRSDAPTIQARSVRARPHKTASQKRLTKTRKPQ